MFAIGLSFVLLALFVWAGFFDKKAAGLLVESEPVGDVFINGKEVGTTPYESSMSSSEILLQIVPKDKNLGKYETKIKLEPKVKTIVKRTFNKDENLSGGVVVSFEKIGTKDTWITIVSIPSGVQVSLDDKAYGFTPILTKINAGDHQLMLTSAGFLGKQLMVRTYKGYKLTAVVQMVKDLEYVPIVNKEEDKGNEKEFFGNGKINEENVDFLEIRKKPDIESEVVGKINPGEEFEALDLSEDGLWLQISFKSIVYGQNGGTPTTTEGWVEKENVILNSGN